MRDGVVVDTDNIASLIAAVFTLAARRVWNTYRHIRCCGEKSILRFLLILTCAIILWQEILVHNKLWADQQSSGPSDILGPSWRSGAAGECADAAGAGADWAMGLSVAIERHAQEEGHGDVCRTSDGGFFCPASCSSTAAAPFCAAGDGYSPCRAAVIRTALRASQEQLPQSPPPPPPPPPQAPTATAAAPPQEPLSPDRAPPASQVTSETAIYLCEFPNSETAAWAAGLTVLLERHSFDPNHGDVCRAQENSQFYCPVECLLHEQPPFCLASDGASTCRASLCEIPNPETAAWASGLVIELERHTEEPRQGDVCRTSSGQHFCPTGCVPTAEAPFCLAANGQESCRAP